MAPENVSLKPKTDAMNSYNPRIELVSLQRTEEDSDFKVHWRKLLDTVERLSVIGTTYRRLCSIQFAEELRRVT